MCDDSEVGGGDDDGGGAPKLDTAKHDAVIVDNSWTLEGPFPSEPSVIPVAPATAWEKARVSR